MKMKFWQWEYDFNKEDAEIVVPLILLLLGLTLTPLNKTWLWVGGVAYYLLFFFLKPCFLGLKKLFGRVHHWWIFRCSHCKSRDVVEQGYQEYKGDVPYAFYICNRCDETSVLVRDRLIKAVRKGTRSLAK
jgi:hypothetical protein